MYNLRYANIPKHSYITNKTYINNKNNQRSIPCNSDNYNTKTTEKTNLEDNFEKKAKKQTETRSITNLFQLNPNEVIFEIFGLKVYLDDLLIICILLFLYQEGIQDEYLFICLILLLLS